MIRSQVERSTPKEWDAASYHRLSSPQLRWGLKVLERFELRGNERIIDAGCGSGRLTAELLEKAPFGHVVAVDQSANMIAQARLELARFGSRVSFLEADLTRFELVPPADLIFSTATFHWIHDHRRLFASMFRSLAPRGRLVCQFGAEENLERVHAHADRILAEPEYASRMKGFSSPTYFPSAEITKERLVSAGFENVKTWTEYAPTPFDSTVVLEEFLERVIFRAHLAQLGDEALSKKFLARIVDALENDDPPRTLDYMRLNADAQVPARPERDWDEDR